MRTIRPILLLSLLLCPVGAAFAQGAPPAKSPQPAPTSTAAAAPSAATHEITTEVDAAMNDKAAELFKEGNAAFRAAKYPQAQAAYKAAWALDLRSQRVVHNLGVTELELKMYRDAAEHLTVALRLADPKDPKLSVIEKEVAEARSKVGAINLKVKGGDQEIDGVEIVQMETGRSYQAPLLDPMFVNPGDVSFRIRREGYVSQEKVFSLKAGEETSQEVVLVRAPGFGASTGTATSTGTTTAPVVAPRSKIPGFVVGGVGVAAMAVGGALLGVALGKLDENHTIAPRDGNGNAICTVAPRAGEPAQCDTMRANGDFVNGAGNAGIGLLIGGGVLVAGAVVYLLLPSKSTSSATNTKVVPVVGKDTGGLLLTGSF